MEKVGLRASSGHRTIVFGLVRVQVGMAPARSEGKPRISARLCHPESLTPVKRVWQVDGETVDEPVKCYPWNDTQVVLDDGEVPKPRNSGQIDLTANLAASSVSASMIEKSYLIWPEPGAEEGFGVLLAYCRDNDRALVGTTTDGGTTKGFVVRYDDELGCLVAQLLAYEACVRRDHAQKIVDFMGDQPEASAANLSMAEQLFDALPEVFDWSEVEDDYGKALERTLAAKAAGQTLEAEVEDDRVEKADSLMAALKASVDAVEASPKKKRAAKKEVAA